ncbi:MAG: hypothetical protein LBT01_00205 [Spirochaetaceae bacterium]|jgi:hypothetical protein|nr:hypothetical protein [Spirochaetaceae bacterium]
MKRLRKNYFGLPLGLVACGALLCFASCTNPIADNTTGRTAEEEQAWETAEMARAEALFILAAFDFEQDELIPETTASSVPANILAGKFFVSETESAGISYTLVDGQGAVDNRSFSITGDTLKIGGNVLELGSYYIRVKAQDAYDNIVSKMFTVIVARTPSTPKQAPLVYPNVIGAIGSGNNKLTVEWDAKLGTTKYQVYISRTNNATAAVLQGTYDNPTEPGVRANSVVIETFPQETSNLPNSTKYWLWIKAGNNDGYSELSPVTKVKTFDTVDSYWTDNVVFRWASINGEGYDLTNSTITYHFSNTTTALGYIVDILHHEIFDPADVTQYFPARGRHSEDFTGKPAGVFITKFQEGYRQSGAVGDYYAVYYWGKGVSGVNTLGNDYNLTYMINPWNGHCEQQTYVDAYFEFSCENFRKYNAGVAEPYYRHPAPTE